jgi:ParB-like chromosome segregation protein Spo0J
MAKRKRNESVQTSNRRAMSRKAPASFPIDRIRIGKRFRRDLGDIAGLAASIVEFGLFHPITIKRDGTLLAGHRRLEALRLLGRTEIPVTIWEGDDA